MIVSATGLGNAVKIAIAALKKSAPRLAAIVAAAEGIQSCQRA